MTQIAIILGGIYLIYHGLTASDYFIAALGLFVAFNSAETVYELLTGKNFGVSRKPVKSLDSVLPESKVEKSSRANT